MRRRAGSAPAALKAAVAVLTCGIAVSALSGCSGAGPPHRQGSTALNLDLGHRMWWPAKLTRKPDPALPELGRERTASLATR